MSHLYRTLQEHPTTYNCVSFMQLWYIWHTIQLVLVLVMIKKLIEKIKELKTYNYDFFCSCKICKFLRLVKIKWLDLLSIYLKRKNYIDEYNKRYIEKIKQNIARSLVNPHKEK